MMYFSIVSLILCITLAVSPFVVRLNEGALKVLGGYTSKWMDKTVKNATFGSYVHKINRGIASGHIELSKINITNFEAPNFSYRPHSQGFLEMTTNNGKGDILANWDIFSDYLAYLKFPLKGKVYGTLSGIKADVTIKIDKDNNFIIHQCSTTFNSFELRLGGSLTGNLLHFFRDILSKALKRRGEEYFCQMVSDSLIPFLKTEIVRLPEFFEFNYDSKVSVTQSLNAIEMSDQFLDLQLNNKIYSSNGNVVETISPLPLNHYNNTGNQKMIELFISEKTIQEVMTAAHLAGQFRINFSSPFLRSDCGDDFQTSYGLCIGTLLPNLKTELGSTQLSILVRSIIPPMIRLQNQKAIMLLNVSLEIYRSEAVNNLTNEKPLSTAPIDDSVLSVSIHCEADLQLRINEKKLKGDINIRDSKAILKENKFSVLGQQTAELIVNMSLPFLEDALYAFLENGLDISEIIKIPSNNEVIVIQNGFIQIQTDLDFYKEV